MKLNLNFIYTSIFFILIVVCCIEFHNNDVLESRINTLSKYSNKIDSSKTFKEDYYITQQSKDTNLLLVVFAILVSFSGFFTYVNIIERYNAKMTEINNENDKKINKWNDNQHNLMLLKSELDFQVGLIYSDKAKQLIKTNFVNSLMLSFCSMEKHASVIVENTDNKKNDSLKMLYLELNYINKLVNDDDLFEVVDIEFNIYKDRIERITKVLDNDGTTIFNRITSKIKIT